jgi:hypothetical protein
MIADYQQFLETKRLVVPAAGRSVEDALLHGDLFPFQRDLVRWSLRKGRAALFADTGLGKSFMQLDWARHAAPRALILAPLAVARQTVREAARWGIPAVYARSQEQAAAGITVTNYEMLPHFDPAAFGAVVLDESSILKSFEGKTRTALIKAFERKPMRSRCDGDAGSERHRRDRQSRRVPGGDEPLDMLAAFFVHDDEGWRLKGHARQPFYRWLASWGMSV